MIRLIQLSKNYGTKQVLRSISLNLAEKQTHVLLGSSGSGKSTLLRILLGLIQPDSGKVFLNNKEMTSITQLKIAREVGYVIQDGGLFPHLTAAGNVALAACAFGWNQSLIKQRISGLMQLVQISSDILNHLPKELSGGQKQRISIMRALMLDPGILLLDEPLGALDPIVRAGLQNELKRVFNTLGKTVIWVTHDMNEAAFFGHTVTLLNDGRIEQHGSFKDLAMRPSSSFVKEFLEAQKPSRWLMECL